MEAVHLDDVLGSHFAGVCDHTTCRATSTRPPYAHVDALRDAADHRKAVQHRRRLMGEQWRPLPGAREGDQPEAVTIESIQLVPHPSTDVRASSGTDFTARDGGPCVLVAGVRQVAQLAGEDKGRVRMFDRHRSGLPADGGVRPLPLRSVENRPPAPPCGRFGICYAAVLLRVGERGQTYQAGALTRARRSGAGVSPTPLEQRLAPLLRWFQDRLRGVRTLRS